MKHILGRCYGTGRGAGWIPGKKRVVQPRETWIIVEGQHEALVTKELYDKANENIIGLDVSGREEESLFCLRPLREDPETQEQGE